MNFFMFTRKKDNFLIHSIFFLFLNPTFLWQNGALWKSYLCFRSFHRWSFESNLSSVAMIRDRSVKGPVSKHYTWSCSLSLVLQEPSQIFCPAHVVRFLLRSVIPLNVFNWKEIWENQKYYKMLKSGKLRGSNEFLYSRVDKITVSDTDLKWRDCIVLVK